MDMKQKLAEYKNEVTRWEKVTYRTDSTEPLKKKAVRGEKSMIFLNAGLVRKMLGSHSLCAYQIAHLVMDECKFGTNLVHMTYEEIGEELDLSKGSVIKGMHELLSEDFIRKVRNGRWMLNPAAGTKCFAEDIGRLHDRYAALQPYTPKNEKKGEIFDDTD